MVKAWTEDIIIPTYECGKPEKNPIFLEKRVYQGSSGKVYPYPVIESISDEKTDVTYHAVYLENEYIKVMILPELGGRIQMAYDKVKQRHFVYYNHVIKPALVGLAGPWISGGIEFNWPQHHRPSTFLPVDTSIEEHKDGSVTVWVSEMERMFHQKGMAGFTLRPGHAYLEIEGVLYNRTKLPQTFLWWANPAVKVNDFYQSVFPQDINAVFDHGKRAVSTFPIATGTYYKMDYSAGVDISNYKNIKVPTSYMGVNSKFDFEGGYENDTHGGMLHVANHHVSPGKKQWTWGNGDFGRAWDRNLTDNDGPYIELMAGVYTENQPDFSWIQPGEEKRFTQYFMPYQELGVVKNASKDLVMNITDCADGKKRLQVYATSEQAVRIQVKGDDGKLYYDEVRTLSPETIFDEEVDTKGARLGELNVIIDAVGRPAVHHHLMTWHAESDEVKRIPDPAEAALSPEDTKTVELLYLTGLHLEQYRHATWNPVDYYEEGLRRDPKDVRCNNAMGLWLLRNGRPEKAESYLRRAVKVLMKRNPNPYFGEPLYNLGLALKLQGKMDEAYDWFYKATWNGAWQNAAYYACAQISTLQGRWEDALNEAERAICAGWHHHQSRALRVALLRKMDLDDEALKLANDSLAIDRFNYGALYEKYLLEGSRADLQLMNKMMHGNALNYHELALDYAQAGLWQEAIDVLRVGIDAKAVSPMTYYYIGWAQHQLGQDTEAVKAFAKAEATDSYCCFPNRLEDILALRCAISLNPEGSKAPYYLGCLFYDKRQYDEAISNWELSNHLDSSFPTVWRNLALAAYNKERLPRRH
jgi:tetratricopeptide (TPR) repeat protein